MTPDSSRFWPADGYEPGKSQPSYDKQFVRDYLETLDWDKKAPGPELPAEVAAKTAEKYPEALAPADAVVTGGGGRARSLPRGGVLGRALPRKRASCGATARASSRAWPSPV